MSLISNRAPRDRRAPLAATCGSVLAAVAAILLAATGTAAQARIDARAKGTLRVGGQEFKDLNANGRLDPYEDWRLPVARRVEDLLSKMTLEEKVGMMLINTLNAESGGRVSDRAVRLIQDEKM